MNIKTFMFHVEFRTANGKYILDTIDALKVGPWIAEMFGLFPWQYGQISPVTMNMRELQP